MLRAENLLRLGYLPRSAQLCLQLGDTLLLFFDSVMPITRQYQYR
jgi:hypothetical protein